jgi:hypothetical protein
VGVNPAATIAAVAERCVLAFLRRERPGWPEAADTPGARQYMAHVERARVWAHAAAEQGWHLEPRLQDIAIETPPLALQFRERMQGFVEPGAHTLPQWTFDRDAAYRRLEIRGKQSGHLVALELTACVENLPVFFQDAMHRLAVAGSVRLRLPGEAAVTSHAVSGTLELMVPPHKPYALALLDPRRAAQRASPGGASSAPGFGAREAAARYRSLPGFPRRQRFMRYVLHFEAGGTSWRLRGYKRLRDDPGLDAWRDTATLFVQLEQAPGPASSKPAWQVRGAGAVHVDLPGFLYGQLPSMEVGHVRRQPDGREEFQPTADAAQAAWAIARFSTFFFGSLQRIYAPGATGTIAALFDPHPEGTRR